MPYPKTNLLVGAAAAVTIATLVYLPGSQAESSDDEARATVQAPNRAPEPDEGPTRPGSGSSTPAKVAKDTVAENKPPVDWKAAKAGIERALEARKDAPFAHTPDETQRHAAEEAPMGSLSKEYIRDTVKEDVVPLVRECYNNLLENDPKIAGRMVLKFAIMGDESVGGIVDEMEFAAESEIQDEDFRECVSESMMSTVFDPPDEGGKVVVKYPFVFEVGDEAQVADDRPPGAEHPK